MDRNYIQLAESIKARIEVMEHHVTSLRQDFAQLQRAIFKYEESKPHEQTQLNEIRKIIHGN